MTHNEQPAGEDGACPHGFPGADWDCCRDRPRKMRTAPITLAEANAYVATFHRHNGALPSAKFAVAAVDETGRVVGVAVAGLPKARTLMGRGVLEVNRVCSLGAENACSFLYGACIRAAKALGYSRLITYTLATEPGSSLKASGWRPVYESEGGAWSNGTRRTPASNSHDLGAKVRWEVDLADDLPDVTWPPEVTPTKHPTLWDADNGGPT